MLDVSFIDTDEAIQSRLGQDVREIFDDFGEEIFRQQESELLRDLDLTGRVVVATVGGMSRHSENLAFMKANGVVIYLRTTADVLFNRLRNEVDGRPLLKSVALSGGDIRQTLGQLLSNRQTCYESANLVIDVTGKDVPTIAELLSQHHLVADNAA